MKMLLALLLLLGTAAPARAQQPAGCEPLDAYGTLPLRCVDRRPRLDSTGMARLQRILMRVHSRWTGFEGSFRIAFTVDTTGRVIRRTLRVVDADTGRFAQRYPPVVGSEIRYVPALRGGVPVPVEFEQGLEYRRPGDEGGDISMPPLLLRVRETEEPRGSTIRLEWVPVAAAPLAALNADSSRARQLEAVSAALANPGWDSLAFACVALLDGRRAVRLAPGEVERLRGVRQRVARPGECPETYSTGWAEWNEDGTLRVRPPGAGPDPYVVAVTDVVPWTDDWVVVGLRIRQSAGTEILRCTQHRPEHGAWSTACETTGRSVF